MYVELHAASAFSFLERRVSPGNPGRSRGGPRLPRAGAARPRRRLRRAPLSQSRPRAGLQRAHRRRAHDQRARSPDRSVESQAASRRSQPDPQIPRRDTRSPAHKLARSPASPACPRRFPRRLAQSLSPGLAHEAARAERRRRAGARRARRPPAASSRWPGAPLLHASATASAGLLDRLVGIFGRAQSTSRCSAICSAKQEDDNEMLVRLAGAFRVPVVATGGVRFATPEERPLFDVLTCIREHATLRQAGRRLAANAERYLKPPAQMARLFADHAARRAGDARARRSAAVHDARSGLSLPDYPVPPGETEARSCARSPRSAPAIAIAPITIAPARRSRASSISSRSSSSPATSSSSGTS